MFISEEYLNEFFGMNDKRTPTQFFDDVEKKRIEDQNHCFARLKQIGKYDDEMFKLNCYIGAFKTASETCQKNHQSFCSKPHITDKNDCNKEFSLYSHYYNDHYKELNDKLNTMYRERQGR